MKLIKIVVLGLILLCIIAASWYFRPWSDYSPHKIAALQDPNKYIENFRSMDRLIPHKVVKKGEVVRQFLERNEPINPAYDFNGEQRRLDQFLDESVTTGLLVVKSGVIRHEQYLRGAHKSSLLTSWSVAKSFVATVIAMAHYEGLITSLDDPAEKYAPQFFGTDFGASSLHSLLAMSSGVDFNEDYVADDSDIRRFFLDSFILGQDPDASLAAFNSNRDAFTDFDYISANSHVLSAVLREVYRKPLAEIMSEKIWQPMGMEADASWLQHRNDNKGTALGYCCLNARLRDYARFGQFYLDALNGDADSSKLSQSWLANIALPVTNLHAPGGTKYAGRGYSTHFWLPQNRRGVFFASGVFGQIIWIDPARDLIIVKTSADKDYANRFAENEAAFESISQLYD